MRIPVSVVKGRCPGFISVNKPTRRAREEEFHEVRVLID